MNSAIKAWQLKVNYEERVKLASLATKCT